MQTIKRKEKRTMSKLIFNTRFAPTYSETVKGDSIKWVINDRERLRDSNYFDLVNDFVQKHSLNKDAEVIINDPNDKITVKVKSSSEDLPELVATIYNAIRMENHNASLKAIEFDKKQYHIEMLGLSPMFDNDQKYVFSDSSLIFDQKKSL